MSQELLLPTKEQISFATVETPLGQVLIVDNFDEQAHRSTIREIFDEDCYRVQKLKQEGFTPKVVIDIGAQNGVFTRLASILWPEAWIEAYEPVRTTFRALTLNAGPRCYCMNSPVLGDPIRRVVGNEDEQKWFNSGRFINASTIGWEIDKEIDLLKIDCEGAEANIFQELFELNLIRDIQIITGEWHFKHGFSAVKYCLGPTHNLEMNEEGDYNTFFARRK